MAIYTILNDQKIAKLLVQFPATAKGAQTGAFRAQGIALGTVNTYYKITLTSGEVFFLKIDEVGDRKRLLNELQILTLLTKHKKRLGYQTPAPSAVRNAQHPFIPEGKKFALLFPEIPGKAIFDLPPNKLKTVGAALAQLHNLPIPAAVKPHRFNLAGQDKVFRQIQKALGNKLPDVLNLVQAKRRELKARAPKSERETLIHADLFAENIHWVGNRLSGILDFEAGGRGNPLFDLGVCLHALCHRSGAFHKLSIKAFLSGYLSVRKIAPAQRKLFGYYLDQSAMRFLLTRLRDFELAPGEVKAEPFKDYREFVIRFDENKALRTLLA